MAEQKVGNKLCRSKFPWTSGSEMGMTYKGARARRVSLPGAGISCTPSKNPPPLCSRQISCTTSNSSHDPGRRGLQLNTDRSSPPPRRSLKRFSRPFVKSVASLFCSSILAPFILAFLSLVVSLPSALCIFSRTCPARYVSPSSPRIRRKAALTCSSLSSPIPFTRGDRRKIGNIPVGFFSPVSFRGSGSSS